MKYNNYHTDYELYARILAHLLTQMKYSNNPNIQKQLSLYTNVVYNTFDPRLVDGIFDHAQNLHRISVYNEEPVMRSHHLKRSLSSP
jgi:hypothetical protein